MEPTLSNAPDTDALMPVTRRPAPLMVRGEGSWLWDAAGRRYLDFVQGWAVNCLGHCPEAVQRVLAAQGSTLINASPAYHTAPQIELARELTARARLDHAFFCTSGRRGERGRDQARAQMGPAASRRRERDRHHARQLSRRTLATMAASGKPGFDTLFPPAVPGFVKVPFGDCARGRGRADRAHGRGDGGADPGRRGRRGAARGLPARAARADGGALGSCSCSTRCRPAWAARASSSRASTKASCPTS